MLLGGILCGIGVLFFFSYVPPAPQMSFGGVRLLNIGHHHGAAHSLEYVFVGGMLGCIIGHLKLDFSWLNRKRESNFS